MPLHGDSYGYLLGMYLGDGHIAQRSRSTELRIYCDSAYPAIIVAVCEAIREVRHDANVWVRDRPHARCRVVVSGWRNWPVLFPQHGRGRKHDRCIELTPWQRDLTHRDPHSLVRGLLHSDGCRFVARQRCGERIYSYTRYHFTNRCEDILRIYGEHLDLLGIGWTRPNAKTIAVDRRSEVAKLDAFVGAKR